MFAFVITIHVIVCALLILIVLIQQGKGGGLIDSLSSAESIFGTKTSTFLVKSTSVLAVIFFVTCLSLAFLSVQRSKSLLKSYKVPLQETKKENSIPASSPASSSPQEKSQQQAPAPPSAPAVSQPGSERPMPMAETGQKVTEVNRQNAPAADNTVNPAAGASQSPQAPPGP